MQIVKSRTSQQRAGILAHVAEWAGILRQALDQAEVARSNPYEAARIGRARLEQQNVAQSRAHAPCESGLAPVLRAAA